MLDGFGHVSARHPERADRFLLDSERCLTWVNEDRRPLPAWVEPETMITGVGRSSMILARKSRPFIPGISMSSVTTSG